MVEQPPKGDAKGPFDLEPNVAAGLAYLIPLVGGIVMLVGGGANKFVRWAAAQSIVLWGAFVAVSVVLGLLSSAILWDAPGLWDLYELVGTVIDIAALAAWLWTFIFGFQGKEVRIPVIAGITESIFKSAI